MDILSNVPSLEGKAEAKAATENATKAENIRFHNERVKNGPANFKAYTNGQARRAQRRVLNGRTKKARRGQIKDHFATKRTFAITRAHLQGAGILSYIDGRDLDTTKQVLSAVWLVQRFGEEQEDGTVSFLRDDVVAAFEKALKFCGDATGETLGFPDGYIVPIYEAVYQDDPEAV